MTVVVSVSVACAVTYASKISPKKDWDAFAEWPSRVLSAAFLALAAAKATPRLVLPESEYVCERQGIELECRTDTTGRVGLESSGYGVGDFLVDFGGSLVYEFVFGGIGFVLGLAVATIVLRRRERDDPS